MRTITFFLLLTFVLLLGACQGEAAPEAAEEATAAETAPTVPATAPIAPTGTAPATAEPASAPPTPEANGEPAITATSTSSPTPTITPIPASPVDAITLVPLVEGVFNRPLYLAHAFDERLFVVEQPGTVRIINDGQLLDTPFLDIRDRVGSTQLEQGLLSIAFHPDYQENGRFFAYYTDKSGNVHISSFKVSPENADFADAGSETILLSVDQPYPNHNGGQLKFGPDGYLYAGIGDGGSANDPLGSGQNPATLLGTLIRLDVDQASGSYAIPPSNPFVATDDRLNEVWAYGLRNPWRFSFDRLTGDLYIADVGQNIWEEVNFQTANGTGGENYGWNILEGTHCFNADSCDKSGLELPIFEYDHSEGCSVTGGYVYRGDQFLSLYGNYFVADFCSGNIWRLFPGTEDSWSSAKVLDSDLVISSFGEDVNGELYITVHDQGSVFQIQP